jgi:hypothetical protein
MVDYTVTVAELKRLLAAAMGGGVPAESLSILDGRTQLDVDVTLEDIGYGPASAPLTVENTAEPRPSTAAPPPSTAAPPQSTTARPSSTPAAPVPTLPQPPSEYRIGRLLGVVPRFGKFKFPKSTTLADVLPEARARWSLGDLAMEFVLMDVDGLYTPLPLTEQIGNIDHVECSLMIREADCSTEASDATASVTRPGHPAEAAVGLADDPEPADADTVRLLFRIERNNASVRWAFPAKETVGTVREGVAAKLGVAREAVTLLFIGKALQDKFLIGRVRATGEQGITVYIREEAEVLLLTAKPYRRPE